MEAAVFRREFKHSPALQQGLTRYLYVTLRQLAQTAAWGAAQALLEPPLLCAKRKRKLIRFSRGKLTILDGRGLEAAACGCLRGCPSGVVCGTAQSGNC